MKNVVIHKVVKLIFTEGQLRGYWDKLGHDLTFESLSEQQLMDLAQKLMNNSSHSQLEEHLLSGQWRTEDEAKGKLLAEDDSKENVHIELIDTDQAGVASEILLMDRLIKLDCAHCHFTYYVQDLNTKIDALKCPSCGSNVTDEQN